jgi:hypothetical protein
VYRVVAQDTLLNIRNKKFRLCLSTSIVLDYLRKIVDSSRTCQCENLLTINCVIHVGILGFQSLFSPNIWNVIVIILRQEFIEERPIGFPEKSFLLELYWFNYIHFKRDRSVVILRVVGTTLPVVYEGENVARDSSDIYKGISPS